MKTFKFYIDQKITTWERIHFGIEAKNKKEAVSKAKEILKDAKEYPNATRFEVLHDTSTEMDIEENEGCATRELFLDDIEIANNAEEEFNKS